MVQIALAGEYGVALLNNGTVAHVIPRGELPWPGVCDPSAALKAEGGVVSIAAGAHHAIAVCQSGKTLTWGLNWRGCMGKPPTDDHLVKVEVFKIPVELPLRACVVAAATGDSFSMLLLNSGRVFTFGSNHNGECGLGHCDQQFKPALVGGALENRRVVHIAAGAHHSIVLTNDGFAFSSGYRFRGALGRDPAPTYDGKKPGFDSNRYALVNIEYTKARVVDAACGDFHSLFVLEDGSVAAAGCNNHGQLGNPRCGLKYGSNNGQIVPVLNPDGSGSNLTGVVAATAAGHGSMVVMSDGRILSFGDNEDGQLGHVIPDQSRGDVLLPRAIDVPLHFVPANGVLGHA